MSLSSWLSGLSLSGSIATLLSSSTIVTILITLANNVYLSNQDLKKEREEYRVKVVQIYAEFDKERAAHSDELSKERDAHSKEASKERDENRNTIQMLLDAHRNEVAKINQYYQEDRVKKNAEIDKLKVGITEERRVKSSLSKQLETTKASLADAHKEIAKLAGAKPSPQDKLVKVVLVNDHIEAVSCMLDGKWHHLLPGQQISITRHPGNVVYEVEGIKPLTTTQANPNEVLTLKVFSMSVKY